jgi:flagellar basal-body rod protein FlgB
MGPIYLFDLASRHAQWLTLRQAAVAENISNVNTPGYKAGDVEPFEPISDNTRIAIATSDPRHLGIGGLEAQSIAVKESPSWEIHHSGNSVGLEHELMKANEVMGDYSLNRSITKAFGRMLLASLKG